MMKTVIFAAGVACGCVLGSAMTDEQRQALGRKVGGPVRRLTEAPATQRIGESVRNVADSAAERAATTMDSLADVIEPDSNGAVAPSGDNSPHATSTS
jgi:hypothetical protein